jgi:hypothetical protein
MYFFNKIDCYLKLTFQKTNACLYLKPLFKLITLKKKVEKIQKTGFLAMLAESWYCRFSNESEYIINS